MFEEKDYFMKIVEQFTLAVGKILGLKAENRIEESQEVLDDTLKYFTGLDREVLEALPCEILVSRVSGSREMNAEKCLMLSELLEQQAGIYETKQEMSRARNLYLKSLKIIMTAALDGEDSSLEQHSQVDGLVAKIGRFALPYESKLLLFQYYELGKNYAKAEDLLFDLVEATEANNDIVAKGQAFYERLMQKDETELEEGNLPMDEVLEGLASLKEHANE